MPELVWLRAEKRCKLSRQKDNENDGGLDEMLHKGICWRCCLYQVNDARDALYVHMSGEKILCIQEEVCRRKFKQMQKCCVSISNDERR